MKVRQILDLKGRAVVTVKPDETIETVVARLAENGFGVLVVSSDGISIAGIVSERDVVRHLAKQGEGLLARNVSSIMTSPVQTCNEGDSVDSLMTMMTEHRFRHLPVTEDGKLVGLVSISDVVKVRVRQLEHEADQLERYVSNTW